MLDRFSPGSCMVQERIKIVSSRSALGQRAHNTTHYGHIRFQQYALILSFGGVMKRKALLAVIWFLAFCLMLWILIQVTPGLVH